MADAGDTVRGCVWGAARVLCPDQLPPPRDLLDAIEATYQRLQQTNSVPMSMTGIDYEALARMHDAGYVGQQMGL